MALTVTDRGSGGNNTAGTTFTGVAPSGTIAAGSLGVLIISADNAGSAGSTPVCPTTITDSKGNVWTRRQNPIYDPGAASAGVEIGMYTCLLTSSLLTSDNANVTWAGGASVTAKNFAFKEIAGSVGVPTYKTGAAGTGSATASPTVTTGSIRNGMCVVGAGASESADTWAADADSTNGSWSTFIHRASGTGNSGMSLITQHKIVTATATQTFNPTLTSADVILGWIEIGENITVTPSAASLAATGQASTVTATNNVRVTPTNAALALTGAAPSVATPRLVTPAGASLAVTGQSPTVATPLVAHPAAGSLAATGQAPTVATTAHVIARPDPASLALTGAAPSVATPRTVTPLAASLLAAGQAPTVAISDHQTARPAAASLAVTGQVPSVTTPRLVSPAAASLLAAGQAPTVAISDHQTARPAAASLAVTGAAPSVILPVIARPGNAALTLASSPPSVGQPVLVAPGGGALTATGAAPTVTASANVVVQPDPATLALLGHVPTVATPLTLHPDAAALVLTPASPEIRVGQYVQPASASLTIVGAVPDVIAFTDVVVTPDSGALALVGWPPIVTASGEIDFAANLAVVLTVTADDPIGTTGADTGLRVTIDDAHTVVRVGGDDWEGR